MQVKLSKHIQRAAGIGTVSSWTCLSWATDRCSGKARTGEKKNLYRSGQPENRTQPQQAAMNALQKSHANLQPGR
jgi:hypothetical protein